MEFILASAKIRRYFSNTQSVVVVLACVLLAYMHVAGMFA